ncbi:MAG: hypothetical protein ABI045_02290 [Flavobacteriales bacterium]
MLRPLKDIPYSITILAVKFGTFEDTHKIADTKSKIYPENTLNIKRSI